MAEENSNHLARMIPTMKVQGKSNMAKSEFPRDKESTRRMINMTFPLP